MEINRKQLLNILSAVRPGIGKSGKEASQTTNFIFTGDHIATYNDRVMVMHPYETPESFSVDSADLFEVLNKSNEDILDFTFKDENTLRIKGKKLDSGLALYSKEENRVDSLINDTYNQATDWKSLPSNFVEGVYLCLFSAAKDMTLGILAGVNVVDNLIWSSDRARVSRYELDAVMDNLIINAKDAEELVKFPITTYTVSPHWAFFATEEGVIFAAKRIAGRFSNLSHLFNVSGAKLQFPAELKEAVEAVSFLAEGETQLSKTITVTVNPGLITVTARQSAKGWITRNVEFEYMGDTITFKINPYFFAQVLKKTTEVAIGDKLLFQNNSFQHILALCN